MRVSVYDLQRYVLFSVWDCGRRPMLPFRVVFVASQNYYIASIRYSKPDGFVNKESAHLADGRITGETDLLRVGGGLSARPDTFLCL
jgi:hypothetical protein